MGAMAELVQAGGAAIEVRGLAKSYGGVHAVRGIDLTVERGRIFALLGPNGAGKTTTVEILEGYRSRDGGTVKVLGYDPARQRQRLKSQIGIVLQSSGMDRYLTVSETVAMYAGFYPRPRPVDEVIELVGLEAKRDTRVLKLSGGQQRRLDVAIALAGNPDLLFLDEPTTGFDPSARHEAWEVIRNLAALGKTVLLTTHYMDEAQYLADRVAVISNGLIVAEGSSATIGNRERARARIRYRLTDGVAPPADLTAPPGPDGLTELVPDDLTTALLGHGTVRISAAKVVNTSTYYVAAMASFAVISACYTNIAISVSFQRDTGVLKRMNGTPLPSAIFLGARMVHALFVAIVLVVITAAFGRVLYSADIPTGVTLLRFLVMLVVGAASFCALGFAIASVIPNADASPAIVNASILPLLFLSGIFIPLGSNAPAWIVWIARIFPVRHFAEGMQAGFLGTPFHWTDVLVVAAWGLGGLLFSVRFFSWEPRT